MATLTALLSVGEPTGFWPIIIKAFEGGVGSYILAIVLITLVIRIIWAPFDTFNKKINKKNARIQQSMQPELEKLKAKYGNDKNLLNQKTQELYKRNNFSMAGSCVYMLVFMALNLTIFFTLFSGLNAMADYKISQEYDNLKYNYANVLQLTDKVSQTDNTIFENYQNVSFKIEDKEFLDGENNPITKKALVAYLTQEDGQSVELGFVEQKTDFSYLTSVQKKDEQGNLLFDEENNPIMEEVTITSDQAIVQLIEKYVRSGKEGYVGDNPISEGSEILISQAVQTYAGTYVKHCYETYTDKSSFLWIKNYWVADSPFKRSIFTFDQFKAEIGPKNISAEEEVIYNSFMPELDKQVGRVNGYLILAILSIGVSFLSMYLATIGSRKKGEPKVKQPGGKVMLFVMPIIMGLFAIFYNAVFAIYLVVSQAISAALAPLENLIIQKWEAHDQKKSESKKTVVDYRRK